MSTNDMVDSGVPAPRIASIQAIGDFRLTVRWAEGLRAGRTDEVDLAPAVESYKFYRPLRGDADLFGTVQLVDDGNTVAWGDGEIDMSAATIETLTEI